MDRDSQTPLAVQDLTMGEVIAAIKLAKEHYGRQYDEQYARQTTDEGRAMCDKLYAALMRDCEKARMVLLEGVEECGNAPVWAFDPRDGIFHVLSSSTRNKVHHVENNVCSDCPGYDNHGRCWHRAAALAITIHYEELERRLHWTPTRPKLTRTLAEVQAEADELY